MCVELAPRPHGPGEDGRNDAQTERAAVPLSELSLTPVTATGLFVVAVLAGYRYRLVWKAAGPTWQLWLFGSVAAACLLALGFVPLGLG